jgi:Kef-type K+ transport system membrane component KefB
LIATQDIFDILLIIAIALVFARVLGYIFNRLKQPAVIGEIIAGIIIGGIALYLSSKSFTFLGSHYHFVELNFYRWPEFEFLAELGILFLLFISGLETSLSKLKKMGKSSLSVAIGGVVLPFVLGFLTGYFLNFSINESIIIGLILTATSVGVTVRSLMDLHVLDTNVGATILGGAVIDDVIGIILLAFVLGIESPLWIGLKIVIFFFIFLYLGLKLIDRVLNLGEKIHLPKAFLSISLAILLIYSFFADQAGIAGIIGAFVAGLLIGQTVRSGKIIDDVKALGYGFFIPIFFVTVGASLWQFETFPSLATIGIFSLAIIIVAIIGKIIGCGIGAKITGMSNIESLQVGVGMIPRMELALIIASAAAVQNQILVATVILTIVTTLIAPFMIKATFKNHM